MPAVAVLAQMFDHSALVSENALTLGYVALSLLEVIGQHLAIHALQQHETDRQPLEVSAPGGQPFGNTIGRSRSSRTQSPFSMSASRPSSRNSAISA